MKEFLLSMTGLASVLLIAKIGFSGLFGVIGNIIIAIIFTFLLWLNLPLGGSKKGEDKKIGICVFLAVFIFFSWLFIKIDLASVFS